MRETMKAILVEKAGGPESLNFVEVPRPKPDAGEVLVRLHASGVNFADILCRTASHPGMTPPPLILGCEGGGVVEGLGTGAHRYREGDRVAVYSPRGGTYAEWVAVPEDYALPIPESMSYQDAAAFTHVFLTAYHALQTLGHAKEGEWLVITAAAGGVGTAMLQLARAKRLRVIAGVGSADKFPVLNKLGVEYGIDYGTADLGRRVREITENRGADLILESVGGSTFKQALSCLAPLGRLILFGISSGESPAVRPYDLLKTSSTYAALNLSVLFAHRHDLIETSWRELLELFEAGTIGTLVSQRLPLPKAAEAHRLVESRGTTGKLLLITNGSE